MKKLNNIELKDVLIIDKNWLKTLTPTEAIILAELVEESKYFKAKGEITEDGEFFSTVENITDRLNINRYQQNSAFKKLADLGYITTKLKGIPRRRFVKLLTENQRQVVSDLNEQKIKLSTYVDENLNDTYSRNPADYIIPHTNNTYTNNTIVKSSYEDFPGKKTETTLSENFKKPTGEGVEVLIPDCTPYPPTPLPSLLDKTSKSKPKRKRVTDEGWLDNCERTLEKFDFSEKIFEKLKGFFTYLVELDTKFPQSTIEIQLNQLSPYSEEDQTKIIDTTMACGWKTLSYQIEKLEHRRELDDKNKPSFLQLPKSPKKWSSEEERQAFLNDPNATDWF